MSEQLDITDKSKETAPLLSGSQLFSLDDMKWERAMAAEIRSILANVDQMIKDANDRGEDEAKIMHVGSELVRPGSFGSPPQKFPPTLNLRQRKVLSALQEQAGIEAELKKDHENVYWIVARHKR